MGLHTDLPRLAAGPEPGTVGIVCEGAFFDLTNSRVMSFGTSVPHGEVEITIRPSGFIQIYEVEQDNTILELIRLLEQKLQERENQDGKKHLKENNEE